MHFNRVRVQLAKLFQAGLGFTSFDNGFCSDAILAGCLPLIGCGRQLVFVQRSGRLHFLLEFYRNKLFLIHPALWLIAQLVARLAGGKSLILSLRTGWGFPVLVLLQLGLLERLIGIRLECLIGLLHFQVAAALCRAGTENNQVLAVICVDFARGVRREVLL